MQSVPITTEVVSSNPAQVRCPRYLHLFEGHIQIAQAPDRCEPGLPGEINFPYVFKLLDDLGYDGYVGHHHFIYL
jgi:hydroxypyruvate isomerase